jgi:hypothetical protein
MRFIQSLVIAVSIIAVLLWPQVWLPVGIGVLLTGLLSFGLYTLRRRR